MPAPPFPNQARLSTNFDTIDAVIHSTSHDEECRDP